MNYSSSPHIPIPLLLFALIACSCAALYPRIDDSHALQDYREGTVLVIGCVIIDNIIGYNGPYTVIIKHRKEEEDRLKLIFVRTDSLGYYALTNMPTGYYAIHAVQMHKGEWWLYHSASGEDRWYIVWPRWVRAHEWKGLYPPKPWELPVWPELKEGKIYDFGYSIITGDRDYPDYSKRRPWSVVKSGGYTGYTYPSLMGESFETGRKYHRPPIPEYFIKRYPQSEWVTYLKRLIK